MQTAVKTTCPYCGVGCGVNAAVNIDGVVKISGDRNHPANFGRLCSKGSALGETVDLKGRLLFPMVEGKRVDWNSALATVSEKFSAIIQQHGPEAVAFYVSGQMLTEDYYVANKLMKGFIGSSNIDTNSRLCMSSTVAGHKRAFGSDTVPCSYEDLERAKLIVLVGSNTAWCHPVLYQRMVSAKKNNPDLLVVVIDPRETATCDIADLHLPIFPGTDTVLFNGLLRYLHDMGETNSLYVQNFTEGSESALAAVNTEKYAIDAVAQQCRLSPKAVTRFYRLYARTERVVTVYSQGVNQSSSGTDKVNSIINCHLLTGRLGRPGMGPFSFTGQPNAMGGREVGGLANQLAAHMEIENPQHRDIVQTFWQSPRMVQNYGLKTVEMFRAIHEGKIKAIWIMCTNPVVSMPDADYVREALNNCELVVVSESNAETDTTRCADILLPALTWGEKEGTVTNSERRLSRQRAFLPPPGEARADWWIISQFAQHMGFKSAFNYESPIEIFREHAALSGYQNNGSRDFDISGLQNISQDDYDNFSPRQWPLTEANPQGTDRMFSDGKFFTPGRKAQFLTIVPHLPANATTADFPLILNTGRVRDQWHTMTRTGKTGRLTEHSPEPYVELCPEDAEHYQIKEGMLVRVFSRWGEVIVRARISSGQGKGQVFIPMHWTSQFSSMGRVDAVVNPATDPVSGQPELKHTPVRIEVYKPAWHGFMLSRRELLIEGIQYWVKATQNGFYRYELAGELPPKDWTVWARSILCTSGNDINWVEYVDTRAKYYRGVRMQNNRVDSCIFIAPSHELPSRNWLGSLFKKDALDDTERASLLTGSAPKGQKDIGRIVCACFSVGINTIVDAIRTDKLTTQEEISKSLKAGTNCGSCVPELKKILNSTLQQDNS